MLFTVVSDGSGHVLDLPTYEMKVLAPEDYQELVDMYNERVAAYEQHEKSTVGIELLLCLFLGGLGVHKFYRGKIGGGLLYLFTGGICGIGWFIDTLRLFFKWLKSRK